MAPVIHHYQHAEGGAVHGFTHPLHPEIKKQVRAGELVQVADPEGTDTDTELGRLRALVEALAKASGIDPSTLEAAGLADTPVSSVEPLEEDQDEDDGLTPPEDGDDGDEVQHLCIECGDPVERKGKTGPWPTRHPGCK